MVKMSFLDDIGPVTWEVEIDKEFRDKFKWRSLFVELDEPFIRITFNDGRDFDIEDFDRPNDVDFRITLNEAKDLVDVLLGALAYSHELESKS